MRLEHNGQCHLYRACPRCRQKADRGEIPVIIFCLTVFFTGVVPVIPATVAILCQVFGS